MTLPTTPSLFGADPTVVATGETFEILSARSWVFRFPRELKTPNRTIWGNWQRLANDRNGWERAIALALRTFETMRNLTGWTLIERAAWPHVRQHREHRVMTIRRLVPTPQSFCREQRNLQFSVKGLEDALVRQQLLADDADSWLTCAPITQHVAPHGQFVTIVLLERPAIAGQEV